MSLPDLNATGDLPPGVHSATIEEVLRRFDASDGPRHACAKRLVHVYDLARRTGSLHRLIVFGSFITAKPAPNDVDIVLLMKDEFRLEECPPELRGLFDHALAQARYGASVFWVRPGLLVGESVEQFVEHWQTKRDGTKRGIVDIAV